MNKRIETLNLTELEFLSLRNKGIKTIDDLAKTDIDKIGLPRKMVASIKDKMNDSGYLFDSEISEDEYLQRKAHRANGIKYLMPNEINYKADICSLELPAAINHALRMKKIKTFGDLLKLTPADVYDIRGIGLKNLSIIEDTLEKCGLRFESEFVADDLDEEENENLLKVYYQLCGDKLQLQGQLDDIRGQMIELSKNYQSRVQKRKLHDKVNSSDAEQLKFLRNYRQLYVVLNNRQKQIDDIEAQISSLESIVQIPQENVYNLKKRSI